MTWTALCLSTHKSTLFFLVDAQNFMGCGANHNYSSIPYKCLSTFAITSNIAINFLVPILTYEQICGRYFQKWNCWFEEYILLIIIGKLKHMVLSWEIYHTLGNVKKERCQDIHQMRLHTVCHLYFYSGNNFCIFFSKMYVDNIFERQSWLIQSKAMIVSNQLFSSPPQNPRTFLAHMLALLPLKYSYKYFILGIE